ncbi:MAG: hypothetical protein AAFV43_16095, partial [Planctomycetota bacterium]
TVEVNAEIGGDNQDALDMDSDVDGLEYFRADDFGDGQIKLNATDAGVDGELVSIETTLDQTYDAPILLLADSLLRTTQDSIIFNEFVDAADNGVAGTSDFGLEVEFQDTVEVNAEIGGDNQDALDMDSDVDGLQFFTTNEITPGEGQAKLNVTDAAVDGELVAIETTGDQDFNTATLLMQDTLLRSTEGSIIFDGFLDAADNGVAGTSDHGLEAEFAVSLQFNAQVGGDNQDGLNMPSDEDGLEFVEMRDFGAGQIKLNIPEGEENDNVASVLTTMQQLYGAPTLLVQTARTRSTASGVQFRDTVDAADLAGAFDSLAGLAVDAVYALNDPIAADLRGGEVFLGEVGRDNQDPLAMQSDVNGLRFVDVEIGPEDAGVMPPTDTSESLLIDVPVTTTRDIALTVLGLATSGDADSNLTLGEFAQLRTNGDGGGDSLGEVVLSSADDIDIEPAAGLPGTTRGSGVEENLSTVFAEERLTIVADTDGDDGGATVSTIADNPDVDDALGLLVAPIIDVQTSTDPDEIDTQADRFGRGSDVTISSFASRDELEMVFSDGFSLDANSVLINAGAGFDELENNYVKDTTGRRVDATYTTTFAEVSGQASPVINADNSAFGGLNEFGYETRSVDTYAQRAGTSGEPDFFGVNTVTGLVTDPNLAQPNFLMLEQRVAVSDDRSDLDVPAMEDDSPARFFVENHEALDLEGSETRDVIQNLSGVPATLTGDEGNDVLLGRQDFVDPNIESRPIDVIASGSGSTMTPGGQAVFFEPMDTIELRDGDVLAGGDGQDFIFSDVQIFVDPDVPFGRDALYGLLVLDVAGESEVLSGDLVNSANGEINHGVQVGSNDIIRAITGMFLDGAGQKDFFMWLFANPMPLTQANLDKLVQDAYFGTEFPTGGSADKVGILEQIAGDMTLTDAELAVVFEEFGIEERARDNN